MRIVRLVAALGAACAAFFPALAHAADPYPPAPPELTASAGVVIVGDSVELFGTGFAPNDMVTIVVSVQPGDGAALAAGTNVDRPGSSVDSTDSSADSTGSSVDRAGWAGWAGLAMVPVGYTVAAGSSSQVVADTSGSFDAVITLNQVGTATITAFGRSGAADPASVTVIVWPVGKALPVTGNGLAWWVLAGAGLVVVGAMLLVSVRVRRLATAPRRP